MLRYVPSILTLVRVYITNGHWILSNVSSAFTEMSMWFLLFLLLTWCITLIDLYMLSHPWYLGMNSTWLWCMIFFMCCWIHFANILLRIFASIFIKDIVLYIFLVISLSGFSVRMRVIHRMSWGVFPLQSFEEFEKDWYTFFLAYLVEFTCEAIWS